MDEKLLLCLLDSADVTGIVDERIHPLIASQDETRPYIIYTNIAEEYVTSINCNASNTINARYQIDAYTRSYNDLKAIRPYILTAIDNYAFFDAVIQSAFDGVEDDGKWYRVTIDVSLWDKAEQPTVYLTDDDGNILTDELGNQLTT